MKLLILTQYFPPEIGAAAERIGSLARFLRSRCELTVIAPVPSYPWEHVIDGYEQRDSSESNRGYELVRCYKIPKSKNLFVRLFSEVAYAANCLRHALRLSRHDMVLVSSPSFFLGVTAVVLKYILKSEFILDIRDLYPASLQHAGLLTNGPVLRALQRMEHKIYRQARLVTVVNHVWMKEVKPHGRNVITIPNGVDLEAFLRESEAPPAISDDQQQLLADHFAIVFVGNLGMFYDNSLYLKAAKHFSDNAERNYQFIFIGEGSFKLALQRSVERENLPNVHFWDPIPNHQLAAVLKQCSVGIVALQFLEDNVPNKIYEYLAADLDVVACLPGEMPYYLIDSGKVFEHNNTDLDSFLNRLRLLAARDRPHPTPADILYKISRERHFKRLWRHITKLEGYSSESVADYQGKVDLSIKNITEPVGSYHN